MAHLACQEDPQISAQAVSGASDPRALAVEAAKEFLGHPLAKRCVAKLLSGQPFCVCSPADVLGERLVGIAVLLEAAATHPNTIRINVSDDDKLAAVASFATLALKATPYLWSEEVRAAVRDSTATIANGGLALPRHTISSSILPDPLMWWTFETGVTVSDRTAVAAKVTVDAMMIRDYGGGFEIYTVGNIADAESDALGRDHLPFIECMRYEYGGTFPDDYKQHVGKLPLESALVMLAFLNSPYIPKSSGRLLRAERREIARNGAMDAGEEIRFITLRRPHAEQATSDQANHKGRQHRWVVRGHYRAQWYPSESAHHVIWITPYLKGPDGAPMIEHVYKVAR